DSGSRQLESSGRPIRIADAHGRAAQSVGAAASIAGFPLDLIVIEFDVEISCARIRAIDNQQLERVELIEVSGVVTDGRPFDTEGVTSIESVVPVMDKVARTSIHV